MILITSANTNSGHNILQGGWGWKMGEGHNFLSPQKREGLKKIGSEKWSVYFGILGQAQGEGKEISFQSLGEGHKIVNAQFKISTPPAPPPVNF